MSFPFMFKLVWICLGLQYCHCLLWLLVIHVQALKTTIVLKWGALTLLCNTLAPIVLVWTSFHYNMRWVLSIRSALGAGSVKCPNSNSITYAKEKPHSNLVYISKTQTLHVLANDHMWDVPFSFLPVLPLTYSLFHLSCGTSTEQLFCVFFFKAIITSII